MGKENKTVKRLYIMEGVNKITRSKTFAMGEGAPCFRIGGAEDNFIFYIEYCFFFVPVMKLR